MGSLLARSLAVEDERMSETAIKVIIQEDILHLFEGRIFGHLAFGHV